MIPLLNLKRQSQKYNRKIIEGIKQNLNSADYILGKNVKKLEDRIASYLKAKYCVTCSSGTDALLMALMSLNIKKNDIIFTTAYSYISTAEVIKFLGAIPVFVDVKPDTFNIDPNKLELAIKSFKNKNNTYPFPSLIKKSFKKFKLKALIVVDLFGLPAEFNTIKKIAKKNKLKLIEDATQSFGGSYYAKKSGNLADIGCLSFYPTKSLGCDGGAIITNSKKIYLTLLSIRVHGQSKEIGLFDRIGITGRLDTIQATILLEKIKNFTNEIKKKTKIAKIYNKVFINLKNLITPKEFSNFKSAWTCYTLKFKSNNLRNKVLNQLRKKKISSAIYYKKPFHLQKVFNEYNIKENSFKISENLSKVCLSIPIDPYLTTKEIYKITKVIKYAI